MVQKKDLKMPLTLQKKGSIYLGLRLSTSRDSAALGVYTSHDPVMTSQLNCDVQLQPWVEDILDGHGLVFRLQKARIAFLMDICREEKHSIGVSVCLMPGTASRDDAETMTWACSWNVVCTRH